MYYLINNDSPLSFAQQIAICDTFHDLDSAIRHAKLRSERTGQSWEVIELRSVFTIDQGA
jgi:hypothetical protein